MKNKTKISQQIAKSYEITKTWDFQRYMSQLKSKSIVLYPTEELANNFIQPGCTRSSGLIRRNTMESFTSFLSLFSIYS